MASLPAAPGRVVEALCGAVTEARLSRMQQVIAHRTRAVIPVLEDLADPHNGAAILRSAEAFGCLEVHTIESRHRFLVSQRVTRGCDRWLELHRHKNARACIGSLRRRGYRVFAAEMGGDDRLGAFSRFEKLAVVLGNEHHGVSEAAGAEIDGTFRVPMVGFVESLNVSVASAITLFSALRGRAGDLSEAERQGVLAHYLMASVRDARRVVIQYMLEHHPDETPFLE